MNRLKIQPRAAIYNYSGLYILAISLAVPEKEARTRRWQETQNNLSTRASSSGAISAAR